MTTVLQQWIIFVEHPGDKLINIGSFLRILKLLVSLVLFIQIVFVKRETAKGVLK